MRSHLGDGTTTTGAGLDIGTFTGPAGTFQQVTEPTKPARDLFAALHIDPPHTIHRLSAPKP
ncbi:hypothetical protein Franean1_5360 [Parafrankia sp. EAN1pec]|uniref:hypothetical protein n=1 Tax=Parafrankia sp. (strain EAN1pec) TaxID=298653 RepID=UPI000054047F|nr:hypothetical protein Franean1_5360 [Frankia sp. EAN1pec]